MSWYDSVLSNTVGVVYSAATGNVDSWTLSQIKDDTAAGIKQALGPNATDAQVAAAQASATGEVDNYLKSIGAHPDQPCGLRLPVLGCIESPDFLLKMEKIVYGLIFLGGVVGVFYFSRVYGSTFKQAFRKR